MVEEAATLDNPSESGDQQPNPGVPFQADPYGRDGTAAPVPGRWSPETLVKFLTGRVQQIDRNIQEQKLPSSEKMDKYVQSLVSNTLKKINENRKGKEKMILQERFADRFQKFWSNDKTMPRVRPTPEELRTALSLLLDDIIVEFGDTGATQPLTAPLRSRSNRRKAASTAAF